MTLGKRVLSSMLPQVTVSSIAPADISVWSRLQMNISGPSGQPTRKIIDVGLAKALESETTQTGKPYGQAEIGAIRAG
jgi:hypothetical protein